MSHAGIQAFGRAPRQTGDNAVKLPSPPSHASNKRGCLARHLLLADRIFVSVTADRAADVRASNQGHESSIIF
jgi:hypothetical protein